MQYTVFSIAGLSIKLLHPKQIFRDPEFEPFIEAISARSDISIRIFDDNQKPYQVHPSDDWKNITIRCNSSQWPKLKSLRDCFWHIPMERIMLHHDRMFLHSSLVKTAYGGILFTGPSGIGKSTQADLWNVNRGAEIINGDRVILHKEDGVWYGYGSPYSGSSAYYVNQKVPIRMIVFLEQSERNALVNVTAGEAFRKIFLQIAAEHQDQDDVTRICDLIEEIIADIPVIRMQCTPDIKAVNTLEQLLVQRKTYD